jgi:LmbE family N-acetylglucosaminyl deacetylase
LAKWPELCHSKERKMDEPAPKNVAVIVAHPDDETLWAGGTILSHPFWNCFIVSVCRGNDTERAPKFYNALKVLKSEGNMGDLDDGPDQNPLDEDEVEQTILNLLPEKHYDLVFSHNPNGIICLLPAFSTLVFTRIPPQQPGLN